MKAEVIQSSLVLQNTTTKQISPYKQFIAWAASKDSLRLPALAIMFVIHGCITIPLALLSMNLVDGGIVQVAIIALGSYSVLVVNLAALSTKVTIPVYFASTALILLIILRNLIVFLG
ncbi:MAG: hypothetical protein ACJAWV_001069 [Flammeovirgaceae bacterium]|jgi:hypothetical protein